MDPLKLSQLALEILGVCAFNKDASFWRKIRDNLFYGWMVVMHLINILLSGLYFVKNLTNEFDGGFNVLLSATALVCNLHTLGTLRYKSEKIRMIFTILKTINRESKFEASIKDL